MSKAPQLQFDADVNLPKTRAAGVNPVRALIKQALDALPLDQSYHIPVTPEVPEPWTFYAHQVVAENTKYVKKALAGEKGAIKHFALRFVDESDKRGRGARLFRVADLTKAEAERRAEASAAALATRAANRAAKEAAAKEAAKQEAAPATE